MVLCLNIFKYLQSYDIEERKGIFCVVLEGKVGLFNYLRYIIYVRREGIKYLEEFYVIVSRLKF